MRGKASYRQQTLSENKKAEGIIMFGIGWAEIVILALMAILFIGVPLIIIRVVLALQKPTAPRRDETRDLHAQIDDLRDEVERLKRQLAQSDSSDGIRADGPK
jgi:cell division protein FtsB